MFEARLKIAKFDECYWFIRVTVYWKTKDERIPYDLQEEAIGVFSVNTFLYLLANRVHFLIENFFKLSFCL